MLHKQSNHFSRQRLQHQKVALWREFCVEDFAKLGDTVKTNQNVMIKSDETAKQQPEQT
jgi:hypothetical protein